MKIPCKKCYHEMEVNPFQKGELERQLSCGNCGAVFTIRPRIGTDGFDVIFGQGSRIVRNCINCGKKFYCTPSEPIPICPACKNAPAHNEKPKNHYWILKENGKKTGPYTLQEIGEWINDGLLGENDLVETPEGDCLKVYKIPELSYYMRDYYSKTKKVVHPSQKKTFRKTVFQIQIPFGKIFLFCFAAALVVWAYLIFKDTGNQSDQIDQLSLLRNRWSKSFKDTPKNLLFYHDKGLEELKLHTLRSCIKARDNFIRAFLKKEDYIEELPFVSLALSCIYLYTGDSKVANSAIEVNRFALSLSPPPVEALQAQGLVLLRLGKLEESRLALKKARELDPQNPYTLLVQGANLLNSPSKSDQGIDLLIKSSSKDPSLSYANLLLGVDAYKRERFGTALVNLNKRLQKSPYDSEALYYNAQINIKLKKYAKAKQNLLKAIKNNPESMRERVLLAQLQYKVFKQDGEALRNVELALNQGKITGTLAADAELLLANINIRNKKYENALKEAEKGLRIKPTDHYLKLSKIEALLSLKRSDESAQLIQGLMLDEDNLPDDYKLHLLETFETHGLESEAFDLMAKYVSGKPKVLYPFLKIATIYLEKQKGELAKRTLLLGMDRTMLFRQTDFLPNLRAPHLNVNINQVGNKLRAVSKNLMNMDLVETAIAVTIMQGSPDRTTPPNLNRAKRNLAGVLTRDKNIIHSYLALAYINLVTGNIKKASQFLKNATEMDIKSTSISITLGMLHNYRGEKIQARSKLKDASLNDWINFFATFELGNVELKLKNRKDAYALFRDSYKMEKDFYPTISKLVELEISK